MAKTNNHLEQSPSAQPTGSVQSTGSAQPNGSHELENPAFIQELECENPEFSKALHMNPESSPLSKSEQSNFVVLSDSEELT